MSMFICDFSLHHIVYIVPKDAVKRHFEHGYRHMLPLPQSLDCESLCCNEGLFRYLAEKESKEHD